jgi:hypothetical protein
MAAARWIRLHLRDVAEMRAACEGFALAQSPQAVPAALWAGTEGERHAFAVVAPLKFLPGRRTRWRAWALAPLVATYRQHGLSAYTDADRICLSGRPISGMEASAAGVCAVVVADFAPWGVEFMDALRRRAEVQYGWQFDHSWPSSAERAAIADALAEEIADAK